MFNKNNSPVETHDFDAHSKAICNRFKLLIFFSIVSILAIILSFFNSINVVANWSSYIVMLLTSIALLSMIPVSKKYCIAALFYLITAALSIVSYLRGNVTLSAISSIFSALGIFHELKVHSRIAAAKDVKLSKQWSFLAIAESAMVLLTRILADSLFALITAFSFDYALAINILIYGTASAIIVLKLMRIVRFKHTIDLYKS